MIKKLTIPVLLIVLLMTVVACDEEEDSRLEKELREAGEEIGIEIPVPHYLPEGYYIKNVLVSGNSSATLLMSDNGNTLIELSIDWRPLGIIPYKMNPFYKTVEFNGTKGQLISDDFKNKIVWNWYPERYAPGLIIIGLSAPRDVQVDELVSIASSVGW